MAIGLHPARYCIEISCFIFFIYLLHSSQQRKVMGPFIYLSFYIFFWLPFPYFCNSLYLFSFSYWDFDSSLIYFSHIYLSFFIIPNTPMLPFFKSNYLISNRCQNFLSILPLSYESFLILINFFPLYSVSPLLYLLYTSS